LNIVLRKSLLAVSIAMAAASPAMATNLVNSTIALNGGSNFYVNQKGAIEVQSTDFDSIRITGQYAGDSDGISLKSVNVVGDIANEANVNSDDFTGVNYPAAFEVGSVDLNDTIWGRPSQVGGNVTNTANLIAHGIGASGMTVRNTHVGGDVINSGALSISGRNEQAPARGIDLNRATVAGKFANDGDVKLQGWHGAGLNFTNGTSVAGEVSNSAEVSVFGTNTDGVHVENSSFGGDFINTGVIIAHGDNADGIDFDDQSTLKSFVNRGFVNGLGANSVGVRVDGATLAGGIENYGSILGETVAINVEGFGLTPAAADISPNFQINNYGTISSNATAIDGHEHTDLNWKGGGIAGELLGLSKITVTGDVGFAGKRIEANQGLHIASDGTLNMASMNTSLDGDLTVNTGGTLGLPIFEETTDAAILTVDGTAKFESGSNVKVIAQGRDFIEGGREYRLLTANVLENKGVGISSNSAVLQVTNVRANDTELFVTVAPKKAEEVKHVIALGGGNANTQRAGAAYVNAATELAKTNPNDTVLAALMAAGDDVEAVARITKKLSPEVGVGGTKAALTGQQMVSSAVGTRMSSVRQGMSSGEGVSEVGGWFQALNNDSDQDKRDGIDGYNAKAKGFSLGVDGQLTESTVLGLAFSTINTDVDADDGNHTDVDTNAVTGYGSWTSGQFFVDGSLTYGQNRNHSKREIVAGATAKGNYDSDMLGLNALAGYAFDIHNGMIVEPRVAARYSRVNIDGFTEKGSSSANLTTGEQRMEVGELGAGVRLAGQFEVAGGVLEPEVKAMAYHDFIADSTNSTSTFVLGGNSFVTSGASSARDSYELGLGATYRKEAVTVGLGYDRLTKTGFEADTLTAKVRYDF
jgi:outer membrane autotransporter protein